MFDSFTLPFPDTGPFKLCKGTKKLKKQSLNRRIPRTAKRQIFGVELNGHSFLGKSIDQLLQIQQVPGQSVNAMDMQSIPLTQVVQAAL